MPVRSQCTSAPIAPPLKPSIALCGTITAIPFSFDGRPRARARTPWRAGRFWIGRGAVPPPPAGLRAALRAALFSGLFSRAGSGGRRIVFGSGGLCKYGPPLAADLLTEEVAAGGEV